MCIRDRPAHRCPQQHRQQQRQRVTEGTAIWPMEWAQQDVRCWRILHRDGYIRVMRTVTDNSRSDSRISVKSPADDQYDRTVGDGAFLRGRPVPPQAPRLALVCRVRPSVGPSVARSIINWSSDGARRRRYIAGVAGRDATQTTVDLPPVRRPSRGLTSLRLDREWAILETLFPSNQLLASAVEN